MSSIIAKPLDFVKSLFFLVFPMFDSAERRRGGDRGGPVARAHPPGRRRSWRSWP